MRWFVGFLLVAAAMLKAAQLYQHPSSALTDDFSRYWVPLLIGSELGLGLAAIAGMYWRQLRLLAMVLFASFACYSLLMAVQGAASCGCFGSLKINPWWTFVLDLIVFAGLFAEYRTTWQEKSFLETTIKSYSPRAGLIGTAMLSMTVAFGLAWHVAPHHQKNSQEGFQTVGDLIVLEPEDWPGKKFPLLEHIDLDVSQGTWVVLLHRHDCPKCQEVLPQYEQLAMQAAERYQVAIVEVPPHDAMHILPKNHCRTGKLTDLQEWFVQTPVEIELENGVVTAASTELPFLNRTAMSEKTDHYHAAVADGHQPQKRGGAKL